MASVIRRHGAGRIKLEKKFGPAGRDAASGKRGPILSSLWQHAPAMATANPYNQ
jgi:hypothetical protein